MPRTIAHFIFAVGGRSEWLGNGLLNDGTARELFQREEQREPDGTHFATTMGIDADRASVTAI
jgi:hypothetical protein